ncbi:hypothetical protein F53441_7268 [Fusarium austroafricanum]|uniref:Uncharacterized protein n=1 Tax=Fusarium austroafricanum TaxID=2364996 RepID=A0A8H4NSF0_9HYPO|nr:hypothetical protein F53441_7268 [Fusarium austroafricanum]
MDASGCQDLRTATPSTRSDSVSTGIQTAPMSLGEHNQDQNPPPEPESVGLLDLPDSVGDQLVNLFIAYNCVCSPEIEFSSIITAIKSDQRDDPSLPKFEFETEPCTLFIGYDYRSTFVLSSQFIKDNFLTISPIARYVPHSRHRRQYFPITGTITSSLTPDGTWDFHLTDYYMECIAQRLPYTHQPTFEAENWQIVYLDALRPGIKEAVNAHNLRVLGWWARKVSHSGQVFEELGDASHAIYQFTDAKEVCDQMYSALKRAYPIPQPDSRAA